MLVISRRASLNGNDKSDVVFTFPDGRRATIRVLSVGGCEARLGIIADADLIAHRAEVQKRLDAGEARR